MRMRQHLANAIVVVLGLGVSAGFPSTMGTLAAQTLVCDARAEANRLDNAQGYRLRGDRCEGTYRPDVGGPAVSVVGLYRVFDDIELDSDVPLSVRWSAPTGDSVRILVRSVRPEAAYRMDTRQSGDRVEYIWPTTLLRAVALDRSDLLPLAWQWQDDARAALYLPLSIVHGEDATQASGPTLELLPRTVLKDVRVTVARVDRTGHRATDPERIVWYRESIGPGHFVNRRPIRIQLPRVEDPGIYVVEMEAVRRDDSSFEVGPLWYYSGDIAAHEGRDGIPGLRQGRR